MKALGAALALFASAAFATPQDDQKLLELYEATNAQQRGDADFQLASALEKRGLPFSAFIFHCTVFKAGPADPSYLRSVEALVRLQRKLNDAFLIPNLLNKSYADAWSTLPPETLARINVLVAEISLRRSKLSEAEDFATAVPKTSPVRAKALYLKGLALADPRYPGGPKSDEASAAFREILTLGKTQDDLEELQGLAALALARVSYGVGKYAEAVTWYAKAERSTRHRATARFEGAFAHFQNDEPALALAALHSKDVTNGFFPEAPILEATIQFFGRHYPEADAALDRLAPYEKLTEQLRARLAGPPADGWAATVVRKGADVLPPLLFQEVRSNRRLMASLALTEQIDREAAAIAGVESWRGTAMAKDLASYLEMNKASLVMLEDKSSVNRLTDMTRAVSIWVGAANLIRIEIALIRAEQPGAPARFDRAISLLRNLVPMLEVQSPPRAEVTFHLADVIWQQAAELPRADAKPLLAEALRLDESVLADNPKYERADEVLYAAGNLKEWLDDPIGARALYVRLIADFPNSPLVPEASARRDWIRK